MLPISIPTRIHRDYRGVETHLGIEDFILVRTSKNLLESAYTLDGVPPYEDIRRPRDGSVLSQEEASKQRGRPDQRVGWHAQMVDKVVVAVLLIACPAVPELRKAGDHRGLRL